MNTEKLFSVTVDLDTPAEDLAAGPRAPELRRASYAKALPRLLELLDAAGVKATFFAVASHLEDPDCASPLRAAADAGHEVASHGLVHDRELPFRSAADIRRELAGAGEIIEKACGSRPAGFRSPGAVLTPALAEAAEDLGYLYDSSYNPSFAYNFFKRVYAAVNSRRLPAQAQVPGADGDRPFPLGGLVEFPLTVSPLLTLPLMNYFMMGLGGLGRFAVRRACAKGFVNYVVHDHELLLPGDLPVPAAGMTARHLGTPLPERTSFLSGVLSDLKAAGKVLPLREIAPRIKERSP